MFTEKDTFNPNLNPSDEKLREIIAEKDAEIERLKRWCASEKQIINLCECSGDEYCALILKGAEKDAEIERLKTELSTNWAKHESVIKKPLSIKEAIESINSGPGWVTAITISRTEWERLLTAIQRIEKDAERYRKLKAELFHRKATNPVNGKWFTLNASFRVEPADTLDSIIDALPEVQS